MRSNRLSQAERRLITEQSCWGGPCATHWAGLTYLALALAATVTLVLWETGLASEGVTLIALAR
jgi:hypothetical protein